MSLFDITRRFSRHFNLCPLSRGKTLQRSSNSFNACLGRRWNSLSPPSKDMPHMKRQLLTMQPHKLLTSVQKVYDISGYASVQIRTPPLDSLCYTSLHSLCYYHRVSSGASTRYARFPAHTKGYFYFHQQDNMSPLSAEVRFRICENSSVFAEGRDLLEPDGLKPWNIPLYNIAKFDDYAGMRRLLISENLVDPAVISDLAQLPIQRRLTTALYEIGQPFAMDISSLPRVNLVTRTSVQRFMFYNYTRFNEYVDGKRCYPFSGKAQVRLVPSPLPEDAGKPTFFIQFLEFVTPLQCVLPDDKYRMRKPEIGEYLQQRINRTGGYKPFRVGLKKVERETA